MRLARRMLSLATVLAAVAFPSAASAANPTLTGTVGTNDAFTITLADANGDVTAQGHAPLVAGTYDITVRDRSAVHDFHLTGPGGVDQATSVSFIGEVTWTVTLVPGTYSFVCDPHAGQMHGSFTVVAAPVTQNALSVGLAGTGTGAVSSTPAGIACGVTCSASFAAGTSVTLVAVPAEGSTFGGWSGDCGGIGTCTVTVDAPRSVTASFAAAPAGGAATYALSVARAGDGGGSVTSAPAGIACGAACSASFPAGSSVTLSAAPAAGSSFGGWSGACTGTAACTVTLDRSLQVAATFTGVTTTTTGGAEPPTPAGTATPRSARLVSVAVAILGARRAGTAASPRLAVRVRLSRGASVLVRLYRGSRIVASRRRHVGRGSGVVDLRLPLRLLAGRYVVRVRATPPTGKVRVLTRTVQLR